MNEYSNMFYSNDKNDYFSPEEDIFSFYLNSEDVAKQNSSNNISSNIFLPESKNILSDNFFNFGTYKQKNLENNTMFSNLFKIPENAKQNENNEKSAFKTLNLSNNIKGNTSSQTNELIQNKRERKNTKKSLNLSTNSFTNFKANSKSCSSLTEKESGFLLFKTTKVLKNEESEDRSDDDEINELDDPTEIKLKKNRMAAKKSRQKRKIYIQNLEERVKQLEIELENQKKINEKQNRMDDLIELVLIKINNFSDELQKFRTC